jgi:nucleoside triphosphate diphosphatase
MSDRPIDRLLAVMAALREPTTGCPWDLAQDFRSLAPYTWEEAGEVVDALERGDMKDLPGELGDLLFQVVFLARLGQEQGLFDFDAIAGGIADKLVSRHPHVFGDASRDAALDAAWDARKSEERSARGLHGVLDDIPHGLPALSRAGKLGKRAARVGFDWPDAQSASLKVEEEIAEVRTAAAAGDAAAVEEEIGDLLFAVTSWARLLKVDSETALRRAGRKFEQRFAAMERLAQERGLDLQALEPGPWDELWRAAKADAFRAD